MPQTPSFEPRRRNSRVGPLILPGEGRPGDPPGWPLPGATKKAEWDAWVELWRTPQAVAWEQLGWIRTVARYCRVMVAAEAKNAAPALLAQATALEDRLGLTPKAMRLLLWQVDHGVVPEASGGETGVASLDDRRKRLAGGA